MSDCAGPSAITSFATKNFKVIALKCWFPAIALLTLPRALGSSAGNERHHYMPEKLPRVLANTFDQANTHAAWFEAPV